MIEQYHLVGKRHSGRAVRVRELDDIAVTDNLSSAAKLLGPEATGLELKKREWAIGLKQFIVEMSEPCADPFAKDVKWRKVTPADFDGGLGEYFTVKDLVVLENVYREYHDVTKDELDKIMGNVKVVSEG